MPAIINVTIAMLQTFLYCNANNIAVAIVKMSKDDFIGINVLRIPCMYFDYLTPLPFPPKSIPPTQYPPTLCCHSFFFNLWSPIIVINILVNVWPSIGTYLTHQGFYLKNNLTLPLQQLSLSIVPQLGVGCQSQVTPPHWGYCLNWTCLGLVGVVTVLVNSFVQLLCCAPEVLLCCVLLYFAFVVIHHLCLLQSFHFIFYNGPWTLEGFFFFGQMSIQLDTIKIWLTRYAHWSNNGTNINSTV